MKMKRNKPRVFVASAFALGLSACSTSGHHGVGHGMPTEAGQAAFGALAEIVDMLNRDPNTDWEKVNIDNLREHLVDMNALTLNAEVRTQVNADSVVYRVAGTGKTLRAIQAMVPAHASQLAKSLNWDTETKKTKDGATLTIRSGDPKALQRFKALGFFGVMATGSHHQMHHLQMATGQGHVHNH